MTEAYPLAWPMGWPRTERPTRSNFKSSFANSVQGILNQLRLMGAKSVVISSNVTLRRDGLPYANQAQPEDRGVAVYFILKGEEQCIPCDRWNKTDDNMRAIEKTLEALRGLDRWGAKEMVDAAFRGFKALPSQTEAKYAWYVTLDVDPGASQEEIKTAYRKMVSIHHPDKGGNHETFHRIQDAYEQAQSLSRV